nr:hypothetical protein [Deltaproteobacteria bacterium]
MLTTLAAVSCHSSRPASPDAATPAPRRPRVEPPREPIPLRAPPADTGPSTSVTTRPVPAAGAMVTIPAGSFTLGSTPGDPGRDPSVEADLARVQLPAFTIDALPFPNDPAQPASSGLTREAAERACSERGRRLCSELEWERACKGPGGAMFPGGNTWGGALCAQGELGRCASPEGALSMGTRLAEWTRDDIDERAIIRGASATAAAPLHRCASRRTALPTQAGLELTFRCCGGAPPSMTYPREVSRRPFREEPMTAAQVSALIASVPELERLRLREGLAMFLPQAITEVMNHGATTVELHPEYTLTVNPVRWSPTFGEDILVLAGRSRVGSWVAALWVLPDGRYRHASSFLLQNDAVAIALAFGEARREVVWSSCWNCGGEHGAVSYTDANRVLIVQR